MKIVFTGGAGYVGSACLRHAATLGHEVLAYDNLVMGHRAAVDGHPLVEGDLADTRLLTQTLKDFGAEAVMHFAAVTYVGDSVDNPGLYYRNNASGTLSLLEAMREARVSRIVFSSTCAVYGVTPAETLTETAPLEPLSPYARTKLAAEWMIGDFAQAYGTGFTSLRYFNASGADTGGRHGEDHRPESHLIPLVLQVPLRQRGCITVFGDDYPTPDGTCIRDYVHTHDLAAAHLLAVEAMEDATREIYNVGTGNGHSVMEVIEACERVTGRPIDREIAGRRHGDPPRLVANSSKLRTKLNWEPRYKDLDEIIESAWVWHAGNPRGYGDN